MTDLIAFVDAISTSPTVRLDLNDDAGPFQCLPPSMPPPRLRRAMSQNAMRDGGQVSSSSYDLRTITLTLDLRTPDQDSNALQLQKLARELDRPTNILKYQPVGASKPVFFRTFRSDMAQLADVIAQKAMRQVTIELLAEPFALGLDESLSGTFTLDGLAGSYEKELPTILGDVAAPLVIDVLNADLPLMSGPTWLAAQAVPIGITAPTMARVATNAAFGTLGTDTTGTTGAGTGYWNGDYISVSFATNASMVTRATISQPTLAAGTYRILARVAETSGSSTYSLRVIRQDLDTGASITWVPDGSGTLDLGLFRFPFGTHDMGAVDGHTILNDPANQPWYLQARRLTGAGSLRIDGLLWVPTIMDDAVSNSTALVERPTFPGVAPGTVIDAESDQGYVRSSGGAVTDSLPFVGSGSLPWVVPGCTNHLWWVTQPATADSTDTLPFTATYKPRYLFVRPVSS